MKQPIAFSWHRLRFWICLLLLFCPLANALATGSVVTVDTNNVLVLNGRKVFPIGFSPGPPLNGKTPTGNDAMQELRDAGGLLYRMVQTTNWNTNVIADQQSILDWAAQHGMFVWLNLREVSEFPATSTNTAASLRNVVDTFRDHPALGLWKNFDEAWWSGISVSNLLNGYNVIKQEDTNHPVVQTHAPRGVVTNLQPYNVAADILAVDVYPVVASGSASNPPITNTHVSQVGDWTKELSQVANGQKQYWMVEQISFSGTTPPAHTLVFPTYTQSRFMAYQAINNGARGLEFFGGNVAATLNAQDAPLGWNWTFWTNVLKPLVQELGDKSLIASALVAPTSMLPITFSGTTAPDIEFAVREVPPHLYIFASKREGTNVSVTFSNLPSWAATGKLLFETPRTVTATNGQFTDTFAQWDVHVYRFLQPGLPPVVLLQPQDVTNNSGTAASFSVTADSTDAMSYQWRLGGTNVAGATNSSLTLTNVQLTNAGNYSVLISNLEGSVTTSNAALIVIPVLNFTNVVVSPRPTGATIVWDTTLDSTGLVAYGLDTNYGSTAFANTVLTTHHAALLSGLVSVTNYYFQLVSSNGPYAGTYAGSFSTDATLILQAGDAIYSGIWTVDSAASDKFSPFYKYASTTTGSASALATFRPNIVTPGLYDISVWYSQGTNRSTAAPVVVSYIGGSLNTSLDETTNGGLWHLIASRVNLAGGINGFVRLGNDSGENGKVVISDAVRFSYSPGQDLPVNGVPPAWWTSFYFGTNSVNSSADPDGDGYSSLAEYIAGTAPNDPNSFLRVRGEPAGTGGMQVIFSPYANGRQYQLQGRAGLTGGAWVNVAASPVSVNGNGEGVITVTNLAGVPQFLRLSVVMTQ